MTLAAQTGSLLDRLAVTVGHQVILLSDVEREIRLTAFLNGAEPDFSPQGRRQAADRLVEQLFLRREALDMAFAGMNEPLPPSALAEFKRTRFHNEAEYRTALSTYRLTEEDVIERLRWQAALLRFIELRFQPGVQISQEEVELYYSDEFVPAWRKQHSEPPPPLGDVETEIREILRQRHTDSAVDRWLGQARTQARIRYYEEAFR